MHVHFPSMQGQTVKALGSDAFFRCLTYLTSAACAKHFFQTLQIQDAVIPSLMNTAFVVLGNHCVTTDESFSQKLILTVAALAASTLFIAALSPKGMEQMGAALTLKAGTALAAFNLLGEMLYTTIPHLIQQSTPPKDEEDVAKLSPSGIRYMHGHYATLKKDFGDDALSALHGRFYDLDLPLPQGKTFQDMRAENQTIVISRITIPETVEAIEALSINQLSWMGFSLLTYGGVSKLSFEIQVALRKVMNEKIGLRFCLVPQTAEDVKKAHNETVQFLHSTYTQYPYRWVSLSHEIQKELRSRFHDLTLEPIHATYISLAHSIPGMNQSTFTQFYRYYSKHLEDYERAPSEFKVPFGAKAAEFNMEQLN